MGRVSYLVVPAIAGFGVSAAAGAELHRFGELALSRDARSIAVVERAPGAAHDVVVLRRSSDGKVIRTLDPCGACRYSGLTFAPDGSLAFLARDRAAGTTAVEVSDSRGTVEVARINGIAQMPRFSPDGSRLALLVTLGATKEVGAVAAGAPQVGEIRRQGDEQRLSIVDLAGPPGTAVRQVSPQGRYVYEYDWEPDGQGVVAITASGDGDANWWVASLDEIEVTGGGLRRILNLPTQARHPRVSPDGRSVAYVGGLMSDYGSPGGDLYTVPIRGGRPTNLTPRAPVTFTSVQWTKGGLRATMLAGPDSGLARLGTRGDVISLWRARVTLSAGGTNAAFSEDGRSVAAVVQSYEHAPELYFGPSTGPAPLTRFNASARPLVRATSVTWTNEGRELQGWLLAPAGPRSPGPSPMIVNVHGGPASASTPNFIVDGGVTATLVKAGYHVFYPNPRGSYGRGEEFVQANRRDFGRGDLRDILAGVDAAARAEPIDVNRLGLLGTSYGGFMGMWANTQTGRFKAIVASAGISNWVSYYGTTGIVTWMAPYFGPPPYRDRKPYEDASPIHHISSARTPTLIYVGERDIEVPASQSLEYWTALRQLGVPSSLVIYAGEGHSIQDPEHVADARRRMIEWFDRYLSVPTQASAP